MTMVQIAHIDGAFRCYVTENGIDRRYIGPRWSEPRRAIEYADLIERTEYVSPFRASGEPSTAQPVAPLRAGVRLDGSPDSPKDGSGQAGG